MNTLLPLAFGPIYIAFGAMALGIGLIAMLGKRPGPERTEKPLETDSRGAATGPIIDELAASTEKKAEFLIRMGFEDIEWISDEPAPDVIAFRVKNPMPLAGGSYLVHFLRRAKGPVDSARVTKFRKAVKGEEGVIKGILITSGPFTVEGWQVAEAHPLELVDGKHLAGLLKMFYPDRFPPDRI